MSRNHATFPNIYMLVREIPYGQVASYGMIASLLPGVTARIAGFAMASTPGGENIPWHRVINSAGKISEREGAGRQQARLEAEGIVFSPSGKVNWAEVRWQGPSEEWMAANGMDFIDFLDIQAKWPG